MTQKAFGGYKKHPPVSFHLYRSPFLQARTSFWQVGEKGFL